MLLILARHGNTFDAGDKIVWVGARTDLPLTAKGREQAAVLGSALAGAAPRIKRVIAGPLKRTQEHAGLVAAKIGLGDSVETDERLREIDYGLWEAKSADEIEALGGKCELAAWNERGTWPHSPGWSPPEETVAANIRHLAGELAQTLAYDDAALLVTSNGVLKFFLKIVPGAFEEKALKSALKVATGACCALQYDEKGWRVLFWNRPPPTCDFASLSAPSSRPELPRV